MSELINKKYVCKLEVISPLHIGAGQEMNWTKGVDFIRENNQIMLLNLRALNRLLGAELLSSLFVNRNENGLKSKLAGLGADKELAIESRFDFDFEASDEIKVQIKNGLNNKPIVPGSSIKGAIRSVLFKYLKQHNTDKEVDVFGTANAGDEFMRFIKISDAAFEKTELMQTKIFNLSNSGNQWDGSWKHNQKGGNTTDFMSRGFHTTYEVIAPLEESEFTIMLAEKAFDNFSFEHYYDKKPNESLRRNLPKKKEIIHQNIQFLFEVINKHTLSYIEKEIAYFKNYNQAEHTDYIIEYYQYLKDLGESLDESCLLRMSSGSGFHSITGDWRFEDHLSSVTNPETNFKTGRKTYYKSRRIAFSEYEADWEFSPMGFVQISLKES